MRLSELHRPHAELDIVYYNSDDYDPSRPDNNWYEQAYEISRICDITPSRRKELSLLALHNDKVVGATWSIIDRDDVSIRDSAVGDWSEQDIFVYDFDMVVHPDYRGIDRVGLRLIEQSIDDARSQGCHMVSGFVVNRRLANVLKRRYGFEPEDGIDRFGDGQWRPERLARRL